MPYPKEFYYLEASAKTEYTKTNTGKIDIKQLLKSKPFWIKANKLEKKPKHLVINDWRQSNWSHARRKKMAEVAHQLINEGFKLYLWQEDQLTPINKEDIAPLLTDDWVLKSRPPVVLDAVVKQAQTQYKNTISREQIHILDDRWIDFLLYGRPVEANKRIVYASDWASQFHGDKCALLDFFAKTDQVHVFVDDEYSDRPKLYPLSWSAITKVDYTSAHITDTHPDVPVEPYLFNLQVLKYVGGKIAPFFGRLLKKSKNLNELDISIESGLEENNYIPFEELRQLRKISLSFNLLDGDKITPTLSLNHLEELEIKEGTLTTKHLGHWLKIAPNLKKIILPSINESLEPLVLANRLLQLETMIVDNLFHGIQAILQASPNLINLTIGSKERTRFSTLLSLPKASLIKLEQLMISEHELKAETLQALILAAPHLKALDLMTCTLINPLNLPPLSLGKLESYNSGEFDNKTTVTFLNAAPNIQHLDMTANKNFHLQPQDPIPRLQNLSTIKLFVNHVKNNLETLLKPALFCKHLRLHSDREDGGTAELRINPGDLKIDGKQIESLDLSGIILSTKQLEYMLTLFPRIKFLNLKMCTVYGNRFNLPTNSLPYLETINSDDLLIKKECYKKLMLAAPKVKNRWDHTMKFDKEHEQDLRKKFKEVWSDQMEESDSDSDSDLDSGNAVGFENDINSEGDGLITKNKPTKNLNPLDADTTLKENLNYKVQQIFSPLGTAPAILVSSYRLHVYNMTHKAQRACGLQNAFSLSQNGDLLLGLPPTKPLALVNNYHSYRGKQYFKLTQEWQSLASISPDDSLIDYQVYPNIPVEIAYSYRDSLYYIRKKTAGTTPIILQWTISCPPAKTIIFPPAIQALITEVRSYNIGGLQLPNKPLTGVDYLHEIIRQKKGACRHRAFAFKELVHARLPTIPVRIIYNQQHAFVEIAINNTWNRCDLGGYPIAVNTISIDSTEAGLFLKDNNGIPYCIKAICSPPTQKRTYEFLIQWAMQHIDSFEEKLMAHLNTLKDLDYTEFTKALSACIIAEKSPHLVHKKIYSLMHSKKYDQHFKNIAKEKNVSLPINPKIYCETLLAPAVGIKKELVKLNSAKALKGLRFALEENANSASRPIYYINTAEDLLCDSPYLVRQGDKGLLKKGPGGALYDFLIANEDKAPVILVNYSQFTAQEIVQFNPLLDKKRTIQGYDVPEKAQIIGLLDISKEDYYQGADFYSRFDKLSSCLVSEEELNKAVPQPNIMDGSIAVGSKALINLFHSSNWKNILFGEWVLEGTQFRYKEGELAKYLLSNTPVELRNAVWDEEFLCFWQEAILRGEIIHEGHRYKIPPEFKLIRSKGYAWAKLKENINITADVQAQALILNPSCLHDFFSHYQLDTQEQNIKPVPGYIEFYKTKTVAVYLTRSIRKDDWARLLTECKKYKVTLNLSMGPNVTIPKILQSAKPLISAPVIIKKQLTPEDKLFNTEVIESTDVDVTVMALTQDRSKNFHVIDVSECKPEDLLHSLEAIFNEQKLAFAFKQTTGILCDATKGPKHLILKGVFSTELVDKLAPYLLERRRNAISQEQLLLITDKADAFGYLPLIHQHQVRVEEKIQIMHLSEKLQELLGKEFLAQSKFSVIQAYCCTLKARGICPPQTPWEGMYAITPSITTNPLSINSAAEALDFNQKRLNAIKQQLLNYPYVFLTGLSGVGKSTFVLKELSKQVKLFIGEENLHAWATHDAKGFKVLFIDEVNLSAREWSEFEGLFQNPARLFIKGQFYQLTPEHKVIFAGNPSNYGGERQLAPFFQRHGGALLFHPLPIANIYEELLKPIFAGCLQQDKVIAACVPILNVYRFFVEHSTKDILISPRELEMMALLTWSYCQKNPGLDMVSVAKSYCYSLAKSLVPQALLAQFEQHFKAPSLNAPKNADQQAYLITASRQNAYNMLYDFLSLAQWRLNTGLNEIQKYGGLGGIVLEGEPGMGKSELVLHVLAQFGYKEVKANRPIPDKPFYKMAVSLSYEEKVHLLYKAFNAGAVVLIDEINSAPMMERLVNDLLMYKTPQGQRPLRPGFMIIGTQNPATMPGRRYASTALLRRMTQINLPDYTQEEMEDILAARSRFIPPLEIKPLVASFIRNRNQAMTSFFSFIPSFRDLLNVFERIFNFISRIVASAEPSPPIAAKALRKRKHETELVLPGPSNTKVAAAVAANNQKVEPVEQSIATQAKRTRPDFFKPHIYNEQQGPDHQQLKIS